MVAVWHPTKVTFTLDAEIVRKIESGTRAKPKSQIVHDAIGDYHARIGRLSEAERQRMWKLFDTLVPRIPARRQKAVDEELKEIRSARRSGGRLSNADKRK